MGVFIFLSIALTLIGYPQYGNAEPIPDCPDPDKCLESVLKNSFKGDPGVTIYNLQRLISTFPKTQAARRSLFLMGKIARELKRPEAIGYLSLALAEYPELADYALFYLAEEAMAFRNYKSAARFYRQVYEGYPESYWRSKALYGEAEAYYRDLNYGKTQEKLEAYLREYPDDDQVPAALMRLGDCYTYMGNTLKAAEAYRRVWIMYPSSNIAEEAKTRFDFLRLTDPSIPDINLQDRYKRALSLSQSLQDDLAIKEFQSLIRAGIEGDMRREVMLRLGVSMYRRNRYPEALNIFRELLKTSEDNNGEVLYWIGKIHYRSKDDKKFQEIYTQYLNLHPAGTLAEEVTYRLGDYYAEKGKVQDAVKYYNQVLGNFPSGSFADDALWSLGWHYYMQKDFPMALDSFSLLLDRYPYSELYNQALYWKGRSAEASGLKESALSAYDVLCNRARYTYYCYTVKGHTKEVRGIFTGVPDGINSSRPMPDRLNQGPGLNLEEPAVTLRVNNKNPSDPLLETPNFRKVRELLAMRMHREAANELSIVRSRLSLDKDSLLKVSGLFYDAEDYTDSLHILRRNFFETLERGGDNVPVGFWRLAYPLGYWGLIAMYAEMHRIDPFLLLAIVREESSFDPRAISRSGARGLMQLMPYTAEWISKRIGRERPLEDDLFAYELNISFGTYYLAYLLDRFRGNLTLAIAGYNAGPTAVEQWYKEWGNLPMAEFIDSIPYSETKGYVKRVLKSYIEYLRIYSGSQVLKEG